MAIKKYILDKDNLNNYLNLAIISGLNFELIVSNYTAKIECKENEILNVQFVKEEKSHLFFAYYKELKKEVEEYLKTNTLFLDNETRYFDVASKKDFVKKEILNIDLSSAYLYILFNKKIISETLFNKLNKMKKLDRLGVVGMLASKKNKYYYIGGELQDLEIINNVELSNVFFYCVQETYRIMRTLKNICGNSYIFSWVDGIYFEKEKSADILIELINYLDINKYPFKIETLQNFMYNKYNGNANISYLKNNEEKNFSIPLQKGTFLNDVYELINEKNK